MTADYTPVGRCLVWCVSGEFRVRSSGDIVRAGQCIEFEAGERFELDFEGKAEWGHLDLVAPPS